MQNFCAIAPRIVKLSVLMHHAKAMCCVLNQDHCDLDFDTYDSTTVAPRIIKLDIWMHYTNMMCHVPNLGHFDL